MEKLPARAGWQWVKQGLEVFRKQPGALMALFFSCMFLCMVSLFIPLIGGMAPIVLAPLFTVALLQGCADVDQGKRAMPHLVFIGFRKPARKPLLLLGGLYLLVMLLSIAVLSMLDDGVLMKMATRQMPMDQDLIENSRGALFISSTLYMIGWMLSCLAAPLIYWQSMPIGKALFYSVVTVTRDIKAFLMTSVLLFLMFQVLTAIPVILFSSAQAEVTGIFTVMLLMIVLMHCTLYAAYRQIFGTPPVTPTAVDLKKP
ncbi:hypothetical protein GTP44_05590 [Duganella sp. FT50W]|uniref:DUF2189 domain-containing protein n=1 Tax=Duganella lactea TaxID=2692173 RepID=A0A6L8MGT3_9BURK|nr:BPSS1780 family membrane protein [Duganella lactea]MYM34193.1 hypothetical protein [Duganella lactea]MYM81431.1 hypothetical protein [Duganella lactea]